MSSEEDKLKEKMVEVTVVLNRAESLISKLAEITNNLSLLVNSHAHKLETLEKAIDELNRKFSRLEDLSAQTIRNRDQIASLEQDMKELQLEVEKNYVRKESFEFIKKVVIGSVMLVLTSVGGAIVALVLPPK